MAQQGNLFSNRPGSSGDFGLSREDENMEVAGHLALAFRALARHRKAASQEARSDPEAEAPLLLQE